MRIHSPSLSELHAFAMAARLGSFALAADALAVTPGAISRAITRLEEHLGQPLFARDGRKSVLTAAGTRYLEAIGPSIDTIEAATLGVRTRRPARQLRVSVTPTMFSHWLIPRLPDFRARFPDTVLSFAPYRRDDPLTAPDIDAWIRSGNGDWPAPIVSHYLVGRELVPICRPQDREGDHAIHTPHDLLARPLLFHTNYPGNWDRWLQGVGCAHGPLIAAADFELVSLLVQAVIAGLGVAVVQRCLVEPELAAGRVVMAVDQTVSLERGYYLCTPAGRPQNPALDEFQHWIVGHATAPA